MQKVPDIILHVLAGSSYMAESGYATASLPSYAAPLPPSSVLPAPSYGAGDSWQQGDAAAPLTRSAAGFTEVNARDDFAEPAPGAAMYESFTASGQADDGASMPAPTEGPGGSMPYDPAYDADMRAALAGHELDKSLAYGSTQGADSVPASEPDHKTAAAASGGSRRETVIEEGYDEDAGRRSRTPRDAGDVPAGGAGKPLLLEYEHDSGADSSPAAASMRSIAAEVIADQHSFVGTNTADSSAATPGAATAPVEGDGDDDASLLSDNASSVEQDEGEDERWRREAELADGDVPDAKALLQDRVQHSDGAMSSQPAGDAAPARAWDPQTDREAGKRSPDGALGSTHDGGQAGDAENLAAAADPAYDSLTAGQAATGEATDPLAGDEEDAEHGGYEVDNTAEAAGKTSNTMANSSPFTADDDRSNMQSTGRTGNAPSATDTGSRPAVTAGDAAGQLSGSRPVAEEDSTATGVTAAVAAGLEAGEGQGAGSTDEDVGDVPSSEETAQTGSAALGSGTSGYGQHGDTDHARDPTAAIDKDKAYLEQRDAASAEQSSYDAGVAGAHPDGEPSGIDGDYSTTMTEGLGEGQASQQAAAHAHASRPFPGGPTLASL